MSRALVWEYRMLTEMERHHSNMSIDHEWTNGGCADKLEYQ